MRAEVNRDELKKFIDMDKVDKLVHQITIDGMIKLGTLLMPIIFEGVMTKDFDVALIANREKSLDMFEQLMAYCFNVMINKINSYGEQAVEYSRDESKSFENE
jgi:hypothetical protein